MPPQSSLHKQQAESEVAKILQKQDSLYHLVSFETFRQGKKIRSTRYNSFMVLCHAITHKHAGWLVCKFATTGSCPLSNALLVYNTATGGTGRLERHIATHKSNRGKTQSLPRMIPQMSKKIIARCAALAVVLDLRPISFTHNKEGLTHFVDSIFRAGQSTPISDCIDPKSLLPSDTSVRSALRKLVDDNRGEYKGSLPDMIKIGGGVTTDGVTLKIQGKQFYDLTLHYIEYSAPNPFSTEVTFHMRNRTLLLLEKKCSMNAEEIRALLSDGLNKHYDCSINMLTTGFTMVTDNASVMARVAQSSVSARIAAADEKWMGCMVHSLNKAMKCCISELANQNETKEIFDDIQDVKKFVRISKQSNWDSLLPVGKHLIQEVETRFATTYIVVQRFLRASLNVEEIINMKNSDSAIDIFASLSKSTDPSGVLSFPALQAVVDALQGVVELQRDWEASQTPTIHLALARFRLCLDKLQNTADGGSVWRGNEVGFVPALRLSRLLCRDVVGWLESKVRIHPLLMVATFSNPLFREFEFICDLNKRRAYRIKSESMVRALLAKIDAVKGSNDGDICGIEHSEDPKEYSDRPVVGNKRNFTLMDYADTEFPVATAVDEVSRYNTMNISDLPIDRSKYMKDPYCVLRFWHMHRATFPLLFEVAIRICAIPVSSCASERVFSAVNRVVSRDRCSLSSDTLEEIIVGRSLLSD